MKIYTNKENGFTTIDLGISMIIIVIFVTIMSSILYSVYISSTESKKTANALNYTVDIFETIGNMGYSSVKADAVLRNLDNINVDVDSTSTEEIATGKIGTGNGAYKITLKVEDQYTNDTIKLITLTIEFRISKDNVQKVEMQRLKY